MTVPTLNNTIDSIEILHNVKPGNVNEASNFLIELQQSNYAWSIADQLLYMNKDLVTSYFGAQTMRNKILLHFEELPVESHLSLKESLMKHLNNINSNTNSTVSTQLSLALADLFCHMVQWKNALQEIITTFSQNLVSIPVLLDVLKFIPEEFSNRSLRLGVNRKSDIYSQLEQHNGSVVSVIERSLPIANEHVLQKCLECLDSWLLAGLFRDSDLIDSPVITIIFNILQRPLENQFGENLFNAAARCVADFFSTDCQVVPMLTHRFQAGVYELETVYCQCQAASNASVAAETGHSASAIASGYCTELCRVFCEMATALLPSVLESPKFDRDGSHGDCRTLTLLLSAARTNRDCCALVLDAIIAATDTHYQPRLSEESRARLSPIFEEFIAIMTRHCAVSDSEDEQSLCTFRSDVFFVMEQIRVFVDIEMVFRRMLGSLSQLLSDQSSSGASGACRSNEAEAVLCIIGSLVKFVDTESMENASWTEQLLTQVILPSISRAQPSFKEVAFTMFGELCRWSARRPMIMDCIIRETVHFVVNTTFDASDDIQMSAFSAAIQSLSTFCKRQSSYMLQADHWALIIQLCQRFPELGFVNKEVVGFFEALGRCLCIPNNINHLKELQQTPEEMAQKLWQLCQINVEIVNQLVAKSRISRVPRDPCDPCVWIDNVSALFSSMPRMVSGGNNSSKSRMNSTEENATTVSAAKQPYLAAYYSVMEHYVWPVLSGLIDCFINDGRVLERVVRILRYSLRSFQLLTKPLLGNIAEKIVASYSCSKESCFLYVGGILVDEFGDDSDCKQGLIQMFHAFSGPALTVLDDNGLHENPNTTEDLFRLMVRLVQHCSPDFLAWESLEVNKLFGMAVRSIPGTNIDAKTLALRFLVESFNCAMGTANSSDNNADRVVVRDRVVAWLLGSNGLEHLWEALLFLCRWRSDEVTGGDLVEDMTDLVTGVRALVSTGVGANDRFLLALDNALGNVGVSRRDGMVYATDDQIKQFRSSMLYDSQLFDGLEAFAKLFS